MVGEIGIAEEETHGLTEYEEDVLDERMQTFDSAVERALTWEEIAGEGQVGGVMLERYLFELDLLHGVKGIYRKHIT